MGFNKSPGAYVDTQHPIDIVDRLKVKTSDMMNIYAIHRMRNMEPNYIQMKVAGVSVASFYTGFSFKHYVGRPDFAITVFLDDKDNPGSIFEGMLRRIAMDLLPERDEMLFDQMLTNYYERLKKNDLDPYWEEYREGEGSKITTIHSEYNDDKRIIEVEEKSKKQAAPKAEELNFEEQFDKLEKDELKEELKQLKEASTKKDEKIRELTQRLTEQISDKSEFSEEVQLLQNQLNEANQRLDDWSLKLADFSEKNTILMETVRKLTEMSMQNNEEMERQGREILTLKKELEEKKGELDEERNKLMNAKVEMATSDQSNEIIEELQSKKAELKNACKDLESTVDTMKKEKDEHLQQIADLKIKIKGLQEKTSMDEGITDDLAEQIIELKKEIKVLRRERDHYRDIVKANNLL